MVLEDLVLFLTVFAAKKISLKRSTIVFIKLKVTKAARTLAEDKIYTEAIKTTNRTVQMQQIVKYKRNIMSFVLINVIEHIIY